MIEHLLIQAIPLAVCLLLTILIALHQGKTGTPTYLASVGWH